MIQRASNGNELRDQNRAEVSRIQCIRVQSVNESLRPVKSVLIRKEGC